MATLNPVTLELVWTRLISAVDEAAKAIVRTSFSTLSNEANDFACVLTDAEGHALAQNTGSIPSFIGTLPATVRAMLAAIPPAQMRPGDVYITNNPWIGTGHLNDVCLVHPVFHGGKLIAFGASTSHVPDIGGRARSTEARELFEEGFHIPPMLLMRDGKADATLLTLLRTNVRTPEQTEGDIWAQVSAVTLIGERVCRTLEDHQLADVAEVAREIFDRSEAEMRRRIAALPDGDYTHAVQTDGMAEPFTLQLRLSKTGSSILADYAGTTRQQMRAVNCPFTYTRAMTCFTLKALLLPELPNNEGIFRCVQVQAPEATLLNPRFPAPVGARAATGHYVPVLLFGALSGILPDKVRAAPGSPLWAMNLSGTDTRGRTFANVMFFNGGTGAGAQQNGADVLSWPSNISATPIEVVERTAPVLVRHKRIARGTGGVGRHHGGNGLETTIECRADEVSAVFMTERLRIAAPGLAGGGDGACGQVLINDRPADPRELHLLHAGSTITIRTPGGGGYGPSGGSTA